MDVAYLERTLPSEGDSHLACKNVAVPLLCPIIDGGVHKKNRKLIMHDFVSIDSF
jgi:hypothetical protein